MAADSLTAQQKNEKIRFLLWTLSAPQRPLLSPYVTVPTEGSGHS